MKLIVGSYNQAQDYHECKDDDGHTHRVDLTTDNNKVGSNESLIGKVVEVESLTPYIEIGHGVKILP